MRMPHLAADQELREFVSALAAALEEAPSGGDLGELVARVQREIRPSRRLTIFLLDRLFRGDAFLAPIVPALDEWIRVAEAGELFADAIAGQARVHDSASALDDLWNVQRVRGQARHAVLAALETLSSAGVADVLGAGATNREAARALRARGEVIGLPQKSSFVYPAFQFDRDARRVLPVVGQVNRLLDARHDPWGVAGWWIGRDRGRGAARWEGVADPERAADLIAAAKAVTEPLG